MAEKFENQMNTDCLNTHLGKTFTFKSSLWKILLSSFKQLFDISYIEQLIKQKNNKPTYESIKEIRKLSLVTATETSSCTVILHKSLVCTAVELFTTVWHLAQTVTIQH